MRTSPTLKRSRVPLPTVSTIAARSPANMHLPPPSRPDLFLRREAGLLMLLILTRPSIHLRPASTTPGRWQGTTLKILDSAVLWKLLVSAERHPPLLPCTIPLHFLASRSGVSTMLVRLSAITPTQTMFFTASSALQQPCRKPLASPPSVC